MIVNCAAYTNVDRAESDYDTANMLNNIAAGNLATAMKDVDGTLIHISTDYVFQGDRNTPSREDCQQNLSVYMAKQNLQAKSRLKLPDANISSYVQLGYTRNGARTL